MKLEDYCKPGNIIGFNSIFRMILTCNQNLDHGYYTIFWYDFRSSKIRKYSFDDMTQLMVDWYLISEV